MSKYLIEDTSLTSLANAIRSKTNKTNPLTLQTMVNEINSITSGVKLFSSVNEMNADTSGKAGDLAVVYSSSTIPVTLDTKFQKVMCPRTVTASGDLHIMEISLVSDDGKITTDMFDMNDWMFRLDINTPNGTIGIEYESENMDGNFRRVTFNGPGVNASKDTIDFGQEVHFTSEYGDWNENISKFIQIDNLNFDGLFKYVENTSIPSYIKLPLLSGLTYGSSFSWDKTYYDKPLNIEKITKIAKKISVNESNKSSYAVTYIGTNNKTYVAMLTPIPEFSYYYGRHIEGMSFGSDGAYNGVGFRTTQYGISSDEDWQKVTVDVYELDLDTDSYVLSETVPWSYRARNTYEDLFIYPIEMLTVPYYFPVNTTGVSFPAGCAFKINADNTFTFYNISNAYSEYDNATYLYTGYIPAEMPFTATDLDLLPGKTAYTNGGTIIGTATSDATATAEDIISGKTAYVNGKKITGTATTGTDTSDATATASDIVVGKTAYVKDEKIEGNVSETTNRTYEYAFNAGPYTDHHVLVVETKFANNHLFRPNSILEVHADENMVTSKIGLTPEKLVEGNTILGVAGTAKIGPDTSDATATSMDLLLGKTAYVNGNKITGVLNNYTNTEVMLPYNTYRNLGDVIEIKSSPRVGNPVCYGEGVTVAMQLSTSAVGLIPEDIVSGKTIFGVTGTAKTGVMTQEEYDSAINVAKDILGPIHLYCTNSEYTDPMELDGNYIVNDVMKIDSIVIDPTAYNWVTINFTNISNAEITNNSIAAAKLVYTDDNYDICGAIRDWCGVGRSSKMTVHLASVPNKTIKTVAITW